LKARDDELDEVRALAAKVAAERFGPRAAEMEEMRTPISLEERLYLGELGFLGIVHAPEYGGSGQPLRHALAVIEEFAKVSRPAAFQIFEANTGPAQVVARLGSQEQKERWLPKIVTGELTMAVAISEAEAGSAATDMSTRLSERDGRLVLNGSKRWISNASEAELYLVYCRMSDALGAKGIGAVVVSKDAPGVRFGKPERLMGFRGIPSCEIFFDDVEVPQADVVVPAGSFGKLFETFSIERLGNATMSLAIGQAALDRTVAYVQERTQFGKPLIQFQAVQMQLADMVLAVDSARLLIERAANGLGPGEAPDTLHVSIAKCAANEMAKRVSDWAIQLHGGYGYAEEYGLERLHRDAHGWAIAGGTPAMQRIRIVSEMLGLRFDQRA